MFDISATEILKMYGKWVEADEFADLISKKKRITKRQAYNLIKKEYKDKKILRVMLPNRTVLYGLAEFGHPAKHKKKKITETLNFEDAFLYDCFKKLEEISEIAVHGVIGIPEPEKALGEIRFLIARLPKTLKDKIKPIEKKELEEISKSKDYENACYHAVRRLMDKLSTLLHETITEKKI